MLTVDHISKYYGNHMAIEDISFSALKGEIIGLIGHNGSGKSTTMGIISDCIRPDSGSVYINDICVQKNPKEAKRKIGYLPEIPPLYLDMTVDEELYFACGLKGVRRSQYEQEISYVCETVGISGVRKRLIRNLSKGYRQRVGVAQALIGSPEVLLLDEPTVGLDPSQMVEFRRLLKDLQKKHIIIFSSHILSEITQIADRIVVISNGKLTADAAPDILKDQMVNERTYILEVEGEEEEIRTLLSGIYGIRSARVDVGKKGTRFIIETAKEIDICRNLFYRLAESKHPIRLFYEKEVRLEDIFTRLTEDRRQLFEKNEGAD